MIDTAVGTFCSVEAVDNTTAIAKREPQAFRSVAWSRNHSGAWVSDCGTYEIAPRYVDGHFAWRGRDVHTDRLICSSIDPEFVKHTCESHAASVSAEAS